MTKAELLTTAKREVERRRMKAEQLAAETRKAIYEAIPLLHDIDEKIANEGMLATSLALDGQREEAQKHLDAVREAAERRRMYLVQNGFTEEQLKPQYFCKLCNDSGILKGKICECVQEEIKKMRRTTVNMAGPFKKCTFDSFSVEVYPEKMEGYQGSPREAMRNILRDCMDYASDFGHNSGSLFLFGDAGLGKTHLALSIASVVLEKGYDVIYVSAQNALSEISSSRFSNEPGLLDAIISADLLILDDLGTEYIDAFVLSKIYEIVNGRMRKPTIYTTNICRQDMLNQRYTEKIASRLLGECHLMRFFGKDLRIALG